MELQEMQPQAAYFCGKITAIEWKIERQSKILREISQTIGTHNYKYRIAETIRDLYIKELEDTRGEFRAAEQPKNRR